MRHVTDPLFSPVVESPSPGAAGQMDGSKPHPDTSKAAAPNYGVPIESVNRISNIIK
jgi:hypothetical protein